MIIGLLAGRRRRRKIQTSRILIIEYTIASKLGSSTERQHGGESQVSQSMETGTDVTSWGLVVYQALKQLGQATKGYMLVFVGESMGVNLFFGENQSASVSWFGAQTTR